MQKSRSRPTIRNGRPDPITTLDPRLGPWANYWPIYYGTSGTYLGNFSLTSAETLPALPKKWIGKILILKGQKPSEIISTGKITPTEANKYVFEEKIPDQYVILGPTQTSKDYIASRLTIYVDINNTIENVNYG